MLGNIPHLKNITPDHIDALAKSVFKNRLTVFFVQRVLSVKGLGTVGCVVLNMRRFRSVDGGWNYVRVKNILNDSDRRVRRIGKHRFMLISFVLMIPHVIATGFFLFFYSGFLRKWFKFLYSSEYSGYVELGRIMYKRIERARHSTWLTRKWYTSLSQIKSQIDKERELMTAISGIVPIIKVNPFETKELDKFINLLSDEGYVNYKDCISIFQDSFLSSPILWEKSQKSFVYTFQLLFSTGKVEFDENIWKCLSKHFDFIIHGKRKSCLDRTLSSACTQLKINKLKKVEEYQEHLHSLKSPENRRILKIYVKCFKVNAS